MRSHFDGVLASVEWWVQDPRFGFIYLWCSLQRWEQWCWSAALHGYPLISRKSASLCQVTWQSRGFNPGMCPTSYEQAMTFAHFGDCSPAIRKFMSFTSAETKQIMADSHYMISIDPLLQGMHHNPLMLAMLVTVILHLWSWLRQ